MRAPMRILKYLACWNRASGIQESIRRACGLSCPSELPLSICPHYFPCVFIPSTPSLPPLSGPIMFRTTLALCEILALCPSPACNHWCLVPVPESELWCGENAPVWKRLDFDPGFTWLRKLVDIWFFVVLTKVWVFKKQNTVFDMKM